MKKSVTESVSRAHVHCPYQESEKERREKREERREKKKRKKLDGKTVQSSNEAVPRAQPRPLRKAQNQTSRSP